MRIEEPLTQVHISGHLPGGFHVARPADVHSDVDGPAQRAQKLQIQRVYEAGGTRIRDDVFGRSLAAAYVEDVHGVRCTRRHLVKALKLMGELMLLIVQQWEQRLRGLEMRLESVNSIDLADRIDQIVMFLVLESVWDTLRASSWGLRKPKCSRNRRAVWNVV